VTRWRCDGVAVRRALGKPVEAVQEANFYKDGQTTPYGQTLEGLTLDTVWSTLKDQAKVTELQVRSPSIIIVIVITIIIINERTAQVVTD
jgi:xanthine dehydrogenase molybdopterin-binding subunit B